ncbi:hypothetical protein Tcan_01143, partial [Toxocara canis]
PKTKKLTIHLFPAYYPASINFERYFRRFPLLISFLTLLEAQFMNSETPPIFGMRSRSYADSSAVWNFVSSDKRTHNILLGIDGRSREKSLNFARNVQSAFDHLFASLLLFIMSKQPPVPYIPLTAEQSPYPSAAYDFQPL